MNEIKELEKELHAVASKYFLKRGRYPEYIAVSNDFFIILMRMSFECGIINPTVHSVNGKLCTKYEVWGIPIKFVARKNYIEAMPRRNRLHKQKGFMREYQAQFLSPEDNLLFHTYKIQKITGRKQP